MSSICPSWMLGDLDLTDFPFSVEFGADHGNPQNVSELIESYLLDGDFVLSDGTGNRTFLLPVMIDDADMAALADAEARLVLECNKQMNRLRVDPGDGFGAPADFRTFRAQVEFRRSDGEEQNGVRRYLLTIPALPQAFSTEVTVTPALSSAASPTVTTISDGTSATGWSSPDGAVGVSSGRLAVPTSTWVLSDSQPTYDKYVATATGTKVLSPVVNFATSPYISADIAFPLSNQTFRGTVANSTTAEVDGIPLTLMGVTWVATTSSWRLTWRSLDSAASSLTIKADTQLQVPTGAGSTASSLLIDNVVRSDAAPVTGSARQKFRTITVPGSVRTPGTLMISHPTAALGDVVVHTCVDMGNGYAPAVSQFGPAGTTDTSLVSGARKTGSSFTMSVPVSTLTPGTYQIVVRAKRTASAGEVAVGWSAQTRLGSTDFGPVCSGSHDVTLDSGTYSIFTVATVELPTARTGANSVAVQRITISSGVSLDIDEVWLFFLGDHLGNRGHLTQVSCGTGTPAAGGPSNRVFVKNATIDDPLPGVFIGTQSDESDATFALAALWGQHSFQPGPMLTTTVTTGTPDADTAYAARAAGHSHAPSLPEAS